MLSKKKPSFSQFFEQYPSNLNHSDKKACPSVLSKKYSFEKQILTKKNKGFKNLYLIEQDGCNTHQDSEATA